MRPIFLILATISLAAARSFSGRGQLRATWRDGEHNDLGCVTDEGRWTTDDTRCGTFEASPVPETPTMFTLQSAAGFCKVFEGRFMCNQDADAYHFGVSNHLV